MTYRLILVAGLVSGITSAHAETKRIALVVEGGGDRQAELELAVAKSLLKGFLLVEDEVLKKSLPTGAAALDDDAIAKLRKDLGAVRVVVVNVKRQGADRFSLTVRGADDNGIPWRFGDATTATLVEVAVKLVEDLPPVAEPPPPAKLEPPPAAAAPAVEKAEPAISPETYHTLYRRKHPYGLLIGGAVAFLLPYFATVGLAANYQGYNPNAANVGYAPIAGPFLARQRMNDKDLKDGYDAGLIVDGVVQVVAFNLLLAGIVYCAVGEKTAHEVRRFAADRPSNLSWTPLLSAGSQGAQVGARVQW